MKVIDNIAVITKVAEPICDAESIMVSVLSLKYETGAKAFAFSKTCFDETFFRLSSGLYESNKGRHFGFLPTEAEAVEWLKR